jgi:hypothetical protein
MLKLKTNKRFSLTPDHLSLILYMMTKCLYFIFIFNCSIIQNLDAIINLQKIFYFIFFETTTLDDSVNINLADIFTLYIRTLKWSYMLLFSCTKHDSYFIFLKHDVFYVYINCNL